MRRFPLPLMAGFALSLLLLGGIFPIACGSNNSPTSPSSPPAPTATPVPSVTFTPTISPSVNLTKTAIATPTNSPTASPTLTPASPSPTSTPTNSPTATPTPDIVWKSGVIGRVMDFSGSPAISANLDVQVNGQPVSDATVYLAGGGLSTPVTLVYGAPQTLSGQVYGQCKRRSKSVTV